MTFRRLDGTRPALYAPPLLWGAFSLAACATSLPPAGGTSAAATDPTLTNGRLEVVFEGDRAYARRGDRQWVIAEVSRDQMIWSPEATRFAYIKAQPRHHRGPVRYDIVIRTLAGDSVNEFAVYRPGRPTQLEWLDEGHISYLAPPGKGGDVYVVHEVETAEIVRIQRGSRFSWSPGRRHLAYVHGRRHHSVEIDGRVVWPNGRTRCRRQVISNLVWSPDGRSLSFLERADGHPQLVVLLELDDPDGQLTWALPPAAASPGNKIFWGDSRVVIGQSMLNPRYAASWSRVR